MSNASVLHVGIVGLGDFGLKYLELLEHFSGIEVTWACDCDPQKISHIVDKYNFIKFTDDLDPMLRDPQLDLVLVVTPEYAHREPVVAALESGKHVITEKPLATREEDAQAMIRAQATSGRLLMTAFLLRFDYRYAQVRQQLSRIAPLRAIHAWRNFDRNLFATFNRSQTFVENAIHDIDLIQWYAQSPVKQVHAYCRNTMGLATPDINVGILEFENGLLATIHSSWLYPRQSIGDLQWNVGMQLMGDRGVLEVANDRGGFRGHFEDSGIVLMDQTAWAQIHGEARGAMGAMLRHFFACARGEAEYAGPTPAEAFDATRTALRLVEAAQSLPSSDR